MTPHSAAADPIPALYPRLLVAMDASDLADRGLQQAIMLARSLPASQITGIHAVAGQLHDQRFRQMEGGLPEHYRREQQLNEQRQTHDSLITRGLNLISDAYLDVGLRACETAGIPFHRLTREGKNYRVLVEAAASGDFDLLVMGAQGVGATTTKDGTPDPEVETLGSVCERVARRTPIDLWVIKRTEAAEGPIVVALDGSPQAYGGLITALELSRSWQRPVMLVSVFNPHYHYAVFNRIQGVLSEEGAQVFKFKEQEKLHEEIIDSGLAKIYQAHLDVGTSIARERGIAVESLLLAGKPGPAIARFLSEHPCSLLVAGKTGIHADPDLDIGSATTTWLHRSPCDLLISCRTFTPEVDRVAHFTTSWSEEAQAAMERVPAVARQMARLAILRYAQDRGHTVITRELVAEATQALMSAHAIKDAGSSRG